MSTTSAQRQAAYRARRHNAGPAGNGERRLNTWLTTEASLALARLARRYGVTQREILERFITSEDDRVLATMKPDSPEWDAYFRRR